MKANKCQIELNEHLKQQKNLIAQKNKYLTDSINYAQIIQNSLLSSVESLRNVFVQSFVFYLPKDIVSGDFYWFKTLTTIKPCEQSTKEKIIVAVADCTGHGVPGALLTMLGITLLNQFVIYEQMCDPSLILKKLDEEISFMLTNKENNEKSSDGMDIALCVVDSDLEQLTYSSAKHSLYLIRNSELTEYHGGINSIGGLYDDNTKSFENNVINLQQGDWIYLSSDGFVSQFGGENDKKFNRKRMREMLIEIHSKDCNKQIETVLTKLDKWKGKNEQVDDILLLGFRYD